MDPSAALQMPFEQFARARGVSADRLARALAIPEDEDLSQPLSVILRKHGLSRNDVQAAMAKANPVAAEAAHKNWAKIRLKFVLWGLVFLVAMVLLATRPITKPLRAAMLAASVVIFGVWLGVEPNAPGTVKDALVLYGQEGVIFPPRVVAFIGFMLMSILGNKVFCGWGCHFGTLQDLLWQVPTRKYKVPFRLSNVMRFGFLAAIALGALVFATDILEPIDPFRIFSFSAIAAVAIGVAAVLLVLSLWVYRPWCTFLCPFGAVSWVGERISLWRPRVNHKTCIDCKACERACPTQSMAGLRAGARLAQDCFACGACMKACPVQAIQWGLKPPADRPAEDAEGVET